MEVSMPRHSRHTPLYATRGFGGLVLTFAAVMALFIFLFVSHNKSENKRKEQDRQAQHTALVAQDTVLSYRSRNGRYTDDHDLLSSINPKFKELSAKLGYDLSIWANDSQFAIAVKSTSGTVFKITQDINDELQHTCFPVRGGCSSSAIGEWG